MSRDIPRDEVAKRRQEYSDRLKKHMHPAQEYTPFYIRARHPYQQPAPSIFATQLKQTTRAQKPVGDQEGKEEKRDDMDVKEEPNLEATVPQISKSFEHKDVKVEQTGEKKSKKSVIVVEDDDRDPDEGSIPKRIPRADKRKWAAGQSEPERMQERDDREQEQGHQKQQQQKQQKQQDQKTKREKEPESSESESESDDENDKLNQGVPMEEDATLREHRPRKRKGTGGGDRSQAYGIGAARCTVLNQGTICEFLSMSLFRYVFLHLVSLDCVLLLDRDEVSQIDRRGTPAVFTSPGSTSSIQWS